jgi:fumarylacetoacetase
VIDPADYGLDNLPFGMVEADDERRFPAVAFEDRVVDLSTLVGAKLLDEETLRDVTTLNAFLERGHLAWQDVRARLQQLLGPGASHHERAVVERASFARDSVTSLLPVAIGDYVDFYSSIEHASNVGAILRPGSPPLPANYRYVPIGYHGRAGTVVPSGTSVRRPRGQRKAPDEAAPTFGPTRQLDVEVEMGWFAGGPSNSLGEAIPADAVREHVFGYVLLNDWSARDIQAWEYQPLGPFLGKSFATSISPWIVTLDALEPFRVAEREHDPEPLPYLRTHHPWAYDIELELLLITPRMREQGDHPKTIARTNLRGMYWTVAQQLAHATSNGATIRPGDLFGTGTISGPTPGSEGSLLELTHRGEKPIALPGDETRGFLEDGDTVIIRGRAQNANARIGFGEVVGTVVG